MRSKRTLAALLSLSLAGCVIVLNDSSDYVKGSGTTTIENRSIASASGLRIENRHRVDLDVEVKVGGAPSLVIEGDNNLVPLVHTEVSGDTLRVWTEERLDSRTPIHVRYTVQRLDHLESSGSVHTEVQGLAGGPLSVSHNGSGYLELRGRVDQLDMRHTGSGQLYADGLESKAAVVDMVGSGRVNIGSVRGDSLRVSTSGSGSFYARGIVRTLDVQVQGSGSAQLNDLRADEASITSNGSGGVQAWVQHKVDARANGSGRIAVTGNPSQRTLYGRNTSIQ
ncbi:MULTISPECIES: head GIN domain-containing protein [unclassified Duganella]|uniref:head GIN domain-containing protein n=1 Tax=unclassified Duganella TaxID=2636909 RepID=UPI000ABFEAE0|nr:MULTISPECIES: head GIN domain-containing protein [unclassified Duganella]